MNTNGQHANQGEIGRAESGGWRSRARTVARRQPARQEKVDGALLDRLPHGPWWLLTASLVGLVMAIAFAGIAGLAFNQTVHDTTQDALRYDIALQDDADDLRVAILDLRHYHRNLRFYGPANDRLIDFRVAYAELLDEIDELEEMGINEPNLPQPQELRRMSEEYYALFMPTMELHASDSDAFEATSDEGLLRLAGLEEAARQIDRLAERQADVAVARIEQASSSARLVLGIVLGGLVLVGAALIFAAIRVIGEIRRLYVAEQAASKGLSEALQAKNDFVADASHELRTPLTVLRGNAEAGLAMEPACVHREILEEIVEESAGMSRLVEELLFLARSDAASPPLELESVPVEPLLAEVASRAAMLVRQRGAVLMTELPVEGTVVADAARIEQAIMALVDNAAKFSPAGGTVLLSASASKEELVVEVADQGQGIPRAELALIFERFYRTDRAGARRRGGAGLGLSIARTIVEAHGGRIEAQSRLGHGTSMRIHLPLGAEPPASLAVIAEAASGLAVGHASA
ncbi:MAG: sensor histidine kinase [Thermomicrobiales bacterium]